jgi:hypothetical protein
MYPNHPRLKIMVMEIRRLFGFKRNMLNAIAMQKDMQDIRRRRRRSPSAGPLDIDWTQRAKHK